MPHLVVLATGGTIASRSGGVNTAGGSVASDSAATLLAGVGSVSREVTVESVDVMRANSFNLTLSDLADICRVINHHIDRSDVDAVVVTHGTDTVEETAFLADLVHTSSKAVVFTGAQLAADEVDSDGPRNLREALLVAAHPASRNRGVLVSFSGSVFGARGLRKAHTVAMQPFDAPGSGPVGSVVDDRVRYSAAAERSRSFALPGPRFGSVRVDLVSAYPGVDGSLLRAAIAQGARGVVVAGTGNGNPGSVLIGEIERAIAEGVVVALGSRVYGGPVHAVYGGGGAVDAVSAGAVLLGQLPVAQARILLALLLDHGTATAAAAGLAAFVDGF